MPDTHSSWVRHCFEVLTRRGISSDPRRHQKKQQVVEASATTSTLSAPDTLIIWIVSRLVQVPLYYPRLPHERVSAQSFAEFGENSKERLLLSYIFLSYL